MLVCFLFSISFMVTFLNNGLAKQFQRGFTNDVYHFISYNLINACLASVAFYIAGGFNFEMNMITFWFSMAFAVAVIMTLVFGVLALSRISVSVNAITTTAGSTLVPSLVGLFFLKEKASVGFFLSIIFMMTAIFLPYRKVYSVGKKHSIPICFSLFLISGANVIIQKYYTLTPGVCDSYSFFLMTNLIIAAICILVITALSVFRVKKASEIVFILSLRQMGNIFARTLLSNIGSIISITLLALMEVSVYSVIYSSLGIISGFILSKFFFKENMPRENFVAVLLAICAIVFNSLF